MLALTAAAAASRSAVFVGAALALGLLGPNVAEGHAHGSDDFTSLKLATWNLEWLVAPATFKRLKDTCVPQGASSFASERRLPCDVAQRFERSSRDFATLARYARQLNADVIALQEVDGVDAARLVFPGYEFCFSGSRHLQNTGFAIRAGVPKRCAPDFTALSLDDSVRRGAALVLFPGETREIHLLSVHLKSGCSDKSLASGEKACNTLARQVPIMEGWIDTQATTGHPFAVLGDFNRQLLQETGPARSASGQPLQVWPEIADGKPPEAALRNAAEGQPFRNCVPGQAHSAFIDHIVASPSLAAALVPGSFERVTFSAADARHSRLSDHCPVAVRMAIRQIAPAASP
jgi:endonuclease/exonuclease/phosphatase family metal-dependent hydrolase